MFTSREIAIAIWFAALLIWLIFTNAEEREDLRKVIVLSGREFTLPVLSLFLYISLWVILLNGIGLWSFDMLKDTILWAIFGAIPISFGIAVSKSNESLLKRVWSNSITSLILVEFLVSTYTFPLLIELVLVPVATVVLILINYTDSKPQYLSVNKLMRGIQIALGVLVIGRLSVVIWANFSTLWQAQTLLDIFIIPILTLLLLMFIYFLAVAVNYQKIFAIIDAGFRKEAEVRRYAKWRILEYLKFNYHKVFEFQATKRGELIGIEVKSDVDEIVGKDHHLIPKPPSSDELRREAWVNAYIKCPTQPDYGELISPDVPMWRDFNWTRLSQRVPHGTKIALIRDKPDQRGAYRVRVGSSEGFIVASLVSNYDPSTGVQPAPEMCAE